MTFIVATLASSLLVNKVQWWQWNSIRVA